MSLTARNSFGSLSADTVFPPLRIWVAASARDLQRCDLTKLYRKRSFAIQHGRPASCVWFRR